MVSYAVNINYYLIINFLYIKLACRCEINVLGGDIFNVVNIGESSRPENIKSLNNSRHRNQSALALGDIAADRGTRIVRSADRLFIIHPDVLVTPSKISEACHCPRKGVLSDRVRSIEMSSPAATLGSIKHVFMEVSATVLFEYHF